MHFAKIVRDKVGELPTISQTQTDDLKVERPGYRLWQSRMLPADGANELGEITVEHFDGDAWVDFVGHGARRVAVEMLREAGYADIADLAERYK